MTRLAYEAWVMIALRMSSEPSRSKYATRASSAASKASVFSARP
jgi:hypothetical protein